MIKLNEKDYYEVVREINTGIYGKKIFCKSSNGSYECTHYLFKVGALVLSSNKLERTDVPRQWTTPEPGSMNWQYAACELDRSKYEVVDEPTLLVQVERLKIETQKRLEERLHK